MNDMYVKDHCQTRVHIGGYVFTITELHANAVKHMSPEELKNHKDSENCN